MRGRVMQNLCDRCPARACYFVTIDVDDLPLSFCAHHANQYEEALSAYVIHKVDLRDTLLQGAP